MSIQTEINRIRQSKADIISALESKGITVPSDASIDDLSALVDAIEIATDPVLQSKTATPTTSSQTIKPDSGYDGLSQVTVNAMPTATQATPSISVSTSGLITASATQTAGYVSTGTKSATKQLTTKGATTYTPTTSNQTIASGTYLTGTQTIKGDANLVADNIKSGVSIFGITGTLESGGGLQMVEGTFELSSTISGGKVNVVTITGVPFKPQIVVVNWIKDSYTLGSSAYGAFGFTSNARYHITSLRYKDGKTTANGGNKASTTYTQVIVSKTGTYGQITPTDDGFTIISSDSTSTITYYPAGLYQYLVFG